MPCELIVALDAQSTREIRPVLEQVAGTVRWVKVGLEMFAASGPECVDEIASLGFKVFLDLKFHDIPNTVAGAVASACRLPVSMMTIHTGGGQAMMAAAVAASHGARGPGLGEGDAAGGGGKGQAASAKREPSPENPLILGVTVLTSIDGPTLNSTGVMGTPAEQVGRLGQLAVEAGLRGLVCSPHEIGLLRSRLPSDVVLVTPGIRPRDARADDQSRVMTPAEAARAGANYIVVGRPVMRAADPAAAARGIMAELATLA